MALKLSPLLPTAQHLGAEFVEVGGWKFAKHFTSVEAEMAAARNSVALADSSPHGKVQIEGEAAEEALRAVFGHAPQAIGSGASTNAGHLYRLRRDVFYMSTSPGGEGQAIEQIQASARKAALFVTVTDLSQGLADIRLLGPRAREVLSKLCALDFAPDKFTDQTIKQTSLAKTKQILLRRDFGALPAFQIIGAQSLAAYVWEVVMESGKEFGIVPIGVAAMRELEQAG
ncbi:MAG: sarcosine oxidase subunit gamma family protein [Anaerolineales bacterium]